MRFLRKKSNITTDGGDKFAVKNGNDWNLPALGLTEMECFVECDYCGGYKKRGYTSTEIPVLIQEESLGLKRRFCVPCWIKAFDIVLGKPNEKT